MEFKRLKVNVKDNGKSVNLGESSHRWPVPESLDDVRQLCEHVALGQWPDDWPDDLASPAEVETVIGQFGNQFQIAYNSHPECKTVKRDLGYGSAEYTLAELDAALHRMFSDLTPADWANIAQEYYRIRSSTKAKDRIAQLTKLLGLDN